MKTIIINSIRIQYMHFNGQDWRSIVDGFDIKYFRVNRQFGSDTNLILSVDGITNELEKGTTLLSWGDKMMIMDTNFFNKVIVEPNQK